MNDEELIHRNSYNDGFNFALTIAKEAGLRYQTFAVEHKIPAIQRDHAVEVIQILITAMQSGVERVNEMLNEVRPKLRVV